MKRLIFWLLLGLLPWNMQAQSEEPAKLQIGGYLKFLQLSTFFDDAASPVPLSPLTNNFFHHRLNLAYFPSERWKVVVEMRNRLFYGEQVKLTPDFGKSIDQQTGLLDLSVRWIDGGGVVLHSIFDRAYLNYATDKIDVTLGRQRINWGLNLIWNPNDLFNALNFLDFDYEERPGTDALRIQYYTGTLSKLELAVAAQDTLSQSIVAMMYKFNTRGYDVQALVGYYQGDLALGGGWEGNLGGAGFKGEVTAFVPLEDSSPDSAVAVVSSLTLDYLFSNQIYAAAAVFYRSQGGDMGGANQMALFSGQPSAKNLFPATWAFAINGSGNVTPLFSLSAAMIYSPSQRLTILVPSVTYSIRENWDIDSFVQALFWQPSGQDYGHGGTTVSFRVRWSY